MKKIALLLVLCLTISVSAQRRKKGQKLSIEQKTELAVKRMAVHLDLTERQQNRIRPMLSEKIIKRQEFRKNRKKNKTRISDEKRYELKMKKLDNRLAFNSEMKRILSDDQYEKFRKHSDKKLRKLKKKMKKRRKKRINDRI